MKSDRLKGRRGSRWLLQPPRLRGGGAGASEAGGHERSDLGDFGVRVDGVASASFASMTGKGPAAGRPSGSCSCSGAWAPRPPLACAFLSLGEALGWP